MVIIQWATAPACAADAASFVSETFTDGSSVNAGQSFFKTWTLRNNGTTTWNSGYKLRWVSGGSMSNHADVAIGGTVAPGGSYTFSVPMTAPNVSGTVREDWKLVNAGGATVLVGASSTIWISVKIAPSTGTIRLTVNDANGSILPVADINAVLLYPGNNRLQPPLSNPMDFSKIPWGNYSLDVYCWDMLGGSLGAFSHGSILTSKTAFTNPKRPLSVKVVYSDGSTPLPNVTVYLDSYNGEYKTWANNRAGGTTGTNGTVTLSAYPTTQPGEQYRIRLFSGGTLLQTATSVQVANIPAGTNQTITTNVALPNTDPNDQISEAEALGAMTSDKSASGTISEPTDVHMFSFSVAPYQRVTFQVTPGQGSNFTANLRLFKMDSHGNVTELPLSYIYTPYLVPLAYYTFSEVGGTYFIAVSGSGNNFYDPKTGAGDTNGSTGSYALALKSIGFFNTLQNTLLNTSVSIQRKDSGGGAIDPSIRTWVVIHGRTDNPNSQHMSRLISAIAAANQSEGRQDQILALDWSGLAADIDLGGFPGSGENYIPAVAIWAANALSAAGFSGSNLNFVGHSWGGNMTDEIAQRLPGGVNTIVALDPAINNWVGNGYNPEASVYFANHSQFSWAFHSSALGSIDTPTRASEAFIVLTGLINQIDAHDAATSLFSYMLENCDDEVSKFFKLSRLLNHTYGPWKLNPNAIVPDVNLPLPAGYEGVITVAPGATADYISPKPPLFYISSGSRITVLGGAAPISNQSQASTSNGTNFGSVQQGQTATRSFTIRNDGGAVLHLGPANVPAGFSLITAPPASLNAQSSATFAVGLNTSTTGTKSGNVNFSTDDSSANPFAFAITGTVTTSPPAAFTATPNNGPNGNISPSTPVSVNAGNSVSFTASPMSGYTVDQWLVNGSSFQTGGNSLLLNNVTGDTSVQVTFKPLPPVIYTVSPSGGAHGVISPNQPQVVGSSDSISFGALPDGGYSVDRWLVNGTSYQVGGNSLTINNVSGNSTVQVTFKPGQTTYTITPSYGANGSITPNTPQILNSGGNFTFIATPVDGYVVDQWLVNGSLYQSGGTLMPLVNINGDASVQVTFKTQPPVVYRVTPSVIGNGSVSPAFGQIVGGGDSINFVATAGDGYIVDQWLVNGTSYQNGGDSLSLSNITADTSVQVTFKPTWTFYTLTVIHNEGVVAKSPDQFRFAPGTQVTLTAFSPAGYRFANWTDDASGTASQIVITMDRDKQVTSNFVPISSGAISVLASGMNAPSSLVADGGELFFVDNNLATGYIKKVPKTGGAVATIVSGAAIYDSGSYRGPGPIQVTDTSIFGGYGGYEHTNIFSVSKNGDDWNDLASISQGQFVGAWGGNVYFSDGFYFVKRYDKTGYYEVLRNLWVRGSLIDAQAIYIMERGGDLHRYDLSSSAYTLLMSNTAEGAIFMDTGNIYDLVSGSLRRVAKTGGSVSTLIPSTTATCAASDGTNVYFAENGIMKAMPVTGGTATTIVSGIPGNVSSIAVDDLNLYWSDTSGGVGNNRIFVAKKVPVCSVNPSSGSNGAINPASTYTITKGGNALLNAFPAPGYVVDTWSVNGTAVQSGGSSLTLTNVSTDASVLVTFRQSTVTVTTSAGSHGSISSLSGQTTVFGSDAIFTATPDAGFAPDTWTVNGTSVQTGGTSLALSNIVINSDVTVSFRALSNLENWRKANFGTSENTTDAADLASPLGDNVPNLVKFATAMDPAKPGTAPGIASHDGVNFLFTYTRSRSAISDGITFSVEWTDDLTASNWISAGVSETAVSQGQTDLVTARVPVGNSGKRFARLRITRP